MNTRFIDACWGKPVDRTPVWLMRQAGRHPPDYMRVRSKCTFLELCKTPELAAEVSIQPVDILGVDAAILFSDILTPVEPMGMKLDFVPGPVFEHPPPRLRSLRCSNRSTRWSPSTRGGARRHASGSRPQRRRCSRGPA